MLSTAMYAMDLGINGISYIILSIAEEMLFLQMNDASAHVSFH